MIDPPKGGGQWTDYYFSNTAGGKWPAGVDGNTGLNPQTAKKSIAEAKIVCFGGPYRRCNFDSGDTWTTCQMAGER